MRRQPKTGSTQLESVDLWLRVINASHALEDASRHLPPEEARDRAVLTLQTLAELFPRTLDPIDDYEKYAVRQLLKALLASLPKRDKAR